WRRTTIGEASRTELICGDSDQDALPPAGFGLDTVTRANAGDPVAMRLLGEFYYSRTKSEALGREWFRRAADAGDLEAPYYLGLLYSEGLRVPLDLREAANWYRKAARLGQPEATHLLAELLRSDRAPGAAVEGASGVLPADDIEAAHWLRAAAEMGDAGAMS